MRPKATRKQAHKLDYDRITHLYLEEGKSAKEVAEIVGTTEGSIRATLSYLGVRKGTTGQLIYLDKEASEVLRREAMARDIDVTDFARRLIKTIIRDDMFNAILDDDDIVQREMKREI